MGVTAVVAKVLPDPEPDPLLNRRGLIGKPLPRVDGRLKVTGRATYSAEHRLDGLVHATIVHSGIAKGKILSIDSQAAENLPGVLAVMTYRNAPRMKAPSAAFVATLSNPLVGSSTTLPIMQTDEIFWNGQAVAVVIAETPELARYAARLVRVTYQSEPAALSLKAEKDKAFVPDHVTFQPAEVEVGDAEAALLAAPVRVDEHYATPAENHQAMEPHASIAVWKNDKQLTLYESAQYPLGFQDSLAEIFDLEPKQIRLITDFVGGSFGAKVTMWSNVPLAAAAARLVNRPVKLVLTREGVNRMVGGRGMIEQRVALGADADGKLTSVIHTGVSMCTQDVYAEQFTLATRHMYATPNLHVLQKVVRLDRLQNTFMRAPGDAPGMFALESAMDELALALKLDPVELHLRNEPDQSPTDGNLFSSRYLRDAYTLGAEKFGWQTNRPESGTQRDGDWLIGTGMAASYYPVQLLPMTVIVRITVAGVVAVRTSTVEIGVGVATIQTQHAAERFGVSLEQVRYAQGDTDLPQARTAGGSAATAGISGAIQNAAEKLTEELLKLADKLPDSPLRGAKPDAVEMRDGGLFLKDKPGTGQTYGDILADSDKLFIEAEGSTPMPTLSIKYAMAAFGAHFCEVRVHADTRQVKVMRFVSAFDCGRIMNRRTAESQIKGGIVMGIGMALLEESVVDERTGRLMNPTLAEYHVPVNADINAIDVYFLDKPDPLTPLGVKPVGETGIVGVAAAVANAVFNATGVRVRSLPITVDKLL